MSTPRRKVFISHYKGDRIEVDNFIKRFGHLFIPKVLGANNNDDFINSSNTDYVMQRIRELYLGDSTVTLVLLGSCTHSRRYVDWEIKSSLKQGNSIIPNGLMGIVLPSQNNRCSLPPRFRENWNQNHENCYAKFWSYPDSDQQLVDWIEDAYNARNTRAHLIRNSKDMMKYNAKCLVHEDTH
ncbi:TIR domain-containing protein [Wohlfahrtiimonas chitiniclastica]|uniref:TIR domain-containing protein n=1 Tax=Wohlfahrtiimonas chitiniclastica TaxID=400946 RepID=A0AB35BZC4_9GAMM|nr:TIR domain-containing protein [Wohlfahrtiimonas chitiniclastica]MBS7825182.1 TIR domain-containing protein [Wohlfahrtiimonas chitiniclastica]MBS7840794.1 TIR domain-containing protein [Wohlfahrtiimonas chitiniclastica]